MTNSQNMATIAAGSETSRVRRRLIRVLQVALFGCVALAVWLIGFSGDDGPAPVLPDTATQFSLDLEVVASTDHDVVYVVEQRARPNYRIFSFDPSSSDAETIFVVPEDAIIYGLALSPDRETLAVGYTSDFKTGGNGLWTLDIDSLEFVEVVSPVEDIFLTDLEWAADGESVLATHVDRTGEVEVLSIAEVAVDTGTITTLVADGITPAVVGDDLYYLLVGEDSARRSVGMLDANGVTSVVAFEGSDLDLDHLVAGGETGEVFVIVLDVPDAAGVTVGDAAEAHGNHDVPGTWWDTAPGTAEPVMQAYDPIIVYSATMTDDALVYATLTGLSVARLDGEERLTLIESRAIRFVAG